jgi:molybdate transport repressor ModE-like protein
MRVTPAIAWVLEGDPVGEPLDPRLLPLLEAITELASLRAAVAHCGISYRAGWGLLREYEHTFGAPLVALERGRGAGLTPSGEQLLAARAAAARRLARVLPELGVDIGPSAQRDSTPKVRLRMRASHDPALVALAEALPSLVGLNLDVSFMGSIPALQEYAAKGATVAGFHVPISAAATLALDPFTRWLHPRTDRLIRFVDREQGIMLPRGNPGKVKKLRDIAASSLRFVNRQRGSGTRLLLDRLLEDAHIDPGIINGYRTEEFTHAAVAATVASGGADVGFGVRAAAAEYHLDFVRLARERYYIAVRSNELKSPAVTRLIAALQSPAFSRIVGNMTGYDAAGAGAILGIEELGDRSSTRSR